MSRTGKEPIGRAASSGTAAAVLTGGRASRFGGDKANALLAGMTLAERALDSLRQAGLEPFIVSKRDRPVAIEGVPLVLEPDQPRHPLAGVAAAIREAGPSPVIVLACDLPLLPAAYLAWLAEAEGKTIVPCPGQSLQPLAARYSPGDLAPIEVALERQEPARHAAAGLDATFLGDDELERFGEPALMFTNVNTPEELRQAEALLQSS